MRTTGITITALLLGCGATGWAQSVRGRIVDAQSRAPVVGATVSLFPVDSQPGPPAAIGVTDDDGRYRLAAPAAGTYHLELQRVGYRKRSDGPFDLAAAEVRRSDYELHPVPLELEPIEVNVEDESARFLASVGFFERQKSDFGRFVDRKQIEARKAHRFTDLLGLIPGVRLVPGGGGLGRTTVRLRGSRLSDPGQCHPRVFVDGLIVIRGDARPPRAERVSTDRLATEREQLTPDGGPEIALDDVVMPDDIEALEVYRSSSQVPAKFGGMSTATQCGVIVVWTRRGGQGGRRR